MSKIAQLGGALRGIPIFGNIFSSLVKKQTVIARNFGKNYLDKQIGRFNIKGSKYNRFRNNFNKK